MPVADPQDAAQRQEADDSAAEERPEAEGRRAIKSASRGPGRAISVYSDPAAGRESREWGKSLNRALKRAADEVRKTGRAVELTMRIEPGSRESGLDAVIAERPAPIRAALVPKPKDILLDRALAAARGRGRIRAAEILAGEEMLSADLFARELGTTRATVNAWRKNGQVLALEGATRGFKYPAWQVDSEGRPFAAIPALFDRLGGSSWAVYRFLLHHHPELSGRTGLEELERGHADRVIEAAASVAEAFA
ncbi:MAG: hypothetical protein QOD42_388 [Sphingomonadales bacterium]|jgi:hypothetical protein|nr:hypothetical protein [Sphingomonadales bacterium]